MHLNITCKIFIYSTTQKERIVAQVCISVTNLNLVHAQSIHPGYKARQCGLACSAHADQQEMALRLTEDSTQENEFSEFTSLFSTTITKKSCIKT